MRETAWRYKLGWCPVKTSAFRRSGCGTHGRRARTDSTRVEPSGPPCRIAQVDSFAAESVHHGWALFVDRYPHAGGPDHYATYLENVDGFEVELVAEGQT